MWSDWSHDSLSSMSIDEAPAKYHANLCQLRNPDDSTLNHIGAFLSGSDIQLILGDDVIFSIAPASDALN